MAKYTKPDYSEQWANTATITTAQTMPISVRQAPSKTIYRVSAGIYDIVG